MSILTINTDFEKLWGVPAPTIEFDLLKYQMFTFYGTEQTCEFSIIDNNENDITDLCEIIFNNNYVHLNEDGDEFVVDSDTSVGNFTTTAVAIYKYKTATVTANTEIETTVEELPRISFTEARYNIETDEGTEDSISFEILNNKNQDVTKDCSISFNNNYVHLNEDGSEFVVGDDVSAGEYSTTATATYTYKGQTATAQTTINVTVNSTAVAPYLCLTALESGNVTINIPANINDSLATSISYSKNGTTWTDTLVNSTLQTITIPVVADENIYFKGIAKQWSSSNDYYTNINCSGNVNVSGNVLSLLYGDSFENQTQLPTGSTFTFAKLFLNNTHIVDASQLILNTSTLTLTDNCYNGIFLNCTSLTEAPELPATTLADGCYQGMFLGCTGLTTSPELPATTLANGCYAYMFSGTAITEAPELPVTTLTLSCYGYMFENCTRLTTAPTLPATTLAVGCYMGMFKDCTGITTAPTLSVTKLLDSCYQEMFKGCTGLTTVQATLSAGSVENSAYWSMFEGCTSLTTAPNLSFNSCGMNGCNSMFKGCTALVTPPTKLNAGTSVTKSLGLSGYQSMFEGCTSLTTAPQITATKLVLYCCTAMFKDCTSLTTAPALQATSMKLSCYLSMFEGCTSLTTAPELPATSLAKNCYQSMFEGCTSLSTSPTLPATTLAESCYYYMFRNTNAIPDTTNIDFTSSSVVSSKGLMGLFAGTKVTYTDLESILPLDQNNKPNLPVTTAYINCYRNMFEGCTSLTTAPELPATTLSNYCYLSMFEGCTSLTTAPELPATTLISDCYNLMFYNCSNLNYIKALFTTTPSNTYTNNWVYGVAATGTYVKNALAYYTTTGVNAIPTGWTVETASE